LGIFPDPGGAHPTKKYSEHAHPPPPRRNTIGIFSKHSLKKVLVIIRIPSLFKLGCIYYSAAVYIDPKSNYVSDATTEVVPEFTIILPSSIYQTVVNKK
jgi:hypothetical protein